MTTAYATIADVGSVGIASTVLATVTTSLGTVTHTGAGTGTATPSGTPAGSWSVVVRIDGSGAVGASKYSYSTDAGATWSAWAFTAASSVLGATGIVVAFVGTFTLGDTYAFLAANAAQDAINAACDEADTYLRQRYALPLSSWDRALTMHVAALAAETILTVRCFTVDLSGSGAVLTRAKRAREWLSKVAAGELQPGYADASTAWDGDLSSDATLALSDTVRGW